METHSSFLDWRIQWIEGPGRLQPMRLQRVRHNLATTQPHFLFTSSDMSARDVCGRKKSIFCGSNSFWNPNICKFSSVIQSCPSLCDPMNCSTPGLPVPHQLPEFTQTHVHWISDAIQPSHPQSSPYPPALNLSQHQGLFIWVSSLHQVAKVLEFQLQHQSFEWTPRTDLL